jgi:hypothetical protein
VTDKYPTSALQVYLFHYLCVRTSSDMLAIAFRLTPLYAPPTTGAIFQLLILLETTSYASVGLHFNFGCIMTKKLSNSISIYYRGTGEKAK